MFKEKRRKFFIFLLILIGLSILPYVKGAIPIVKLGVPNITLLPNSNYSDYSNTSVNSDYWDNLDDPSDINTADLTDDNTYVQVAGDTMTGDLIIGSNNFSLSNVGIGTTSPSYPLDVEGIATIGNATSGETMLNLRRSDGTKFPIRYQGGGGPDIGGLPYVFINYGSYGASGNGYSQFGSGNTDAYPQLRLHPGTGQDALWANGPVSIGGLDPDGYMLEVTGNVSISTDLDVTGDITTVGNVGIGTTSPSDKLHIDSGRIRITDDFDAELKLYNEDASPSGWILSADTLSTDRFGLIEIKNGASQGERFTILQGGNVGIGTTSPTSKLDVNGSIRASSYWGPVDNAVTFYSDRDFTIDLDNDNDHISGFNVRDGTDNSLFYIIETGKVGIGTTTPSHELNVVGDANITGDLYVKGNISLGAGIMDTSQTIGAGQNDLVFDGFDYVYYDSTIVSQQYRCGTTASTSAYGQWGSTGLQVKRAGGGTNPVLTLEDTNNQGQTLLDTQSEDLWIRPNSNTAMALTTDGKVGIGTTTPSHELNVVGDANITGNIYFNVTKEIEINPSRFKLPGVNPPKEDIIGLTPVLSFDKTTNESAYTSMHVIPEYRATTPYEIAFYWSPDDYGAGDVVWCIEALTMNYDNDEDINGTGQVYCVTDSTQTRHNELLKTDRLTLSGAEVDEQVSFRVHRGADNAGDTYDNDAHLVEATIYYNAYRAGAQ